MDRLNYIRMSYFLYIDSNIKSLSQKAKFLVVFIDFGTLNTLAVTQLKLFYFNFDVLVS